MIGIAFAVAAGCCIIASAIDSAAKRILASHERQAIATREALQRPSQARWAMAHQLSSSGERHGERARPPRAVSARPEWSRGFPSELKSVSDLSPETGGRDYPQLNLRREINADVRLHAP